jgi:hypothetical protein
LKRNDGSLVASISYNAKITAAIPEATEPLESKRNHSNDVLEEAKDVEIPTLEAVVPTTQSEPQLTKDCQAEAKADQGCRAVVED